MSIVISIIAALFVLGILVAVHEGGHFFMGKVLGFKILEFSIGMGPKLISREKNGTVYSLRAFPIGGMCAFEGEDTDEKTEGSFSTFPAWKRFLVAFAGPFMNVVLAFVMAAILMLIFGQNKAITLANPQIAGFSSESAPAYMAGLKEGDAVIAVNNTPVKNSDEMIQAIRADEDGDILLTVVSQTDSTYYEINGVHYTSDTPEKFVKENPAQSYSASVMGGNEHTVTVYDTYDEKSGYNMIGASVSDTFAIYAEKYNVLTAVPAGASFVVDVMDQMFDFLGSIFTGGVSFNDVSGIVGVVDVVNDSVSTVIEEPEIENKASVIVEFIMYLAVLLSINLGIINLLPLPALDGGRILFNIIEMVVRRPIPAKVEGMIHTVGLFLLLGLIAVITIKDVVFIFIK
ncbi:MAG: RIP metalloprotease [Clostridia bacterium]|nr:RIP metalloprotease [Clostridia bacterium]